jgi:hypothetical protein
MNGNVNAKPAKPWRLIDLRFRRPPGVRAVVELVTVA